LIGWYNQNQKSASNSNADSKDDDENLDDLPYFIKNYSQLDVEKVLKGIKEVYQIMKKVYGTEFFKFF
jgi:hypothetical protein